MVHSMIQCYHEYFTVEVRLPPYETIGNISYLLPFFRTYFSINLTNNVKN